MLIKKGPFGYFAVERFDSPECISGYACEVIALNRSGCLLPCSIDSNGFAPSAYFDFSGLISIRQIGSALLHGSHRNKKLSKLLEDRRRSAGDFFCSLTELLDNLVSPSEIVLDPEYVFTDENGDYLRFCLIPGKVSPDTLRLSSLDAERLELLLSEPFFDGVLTNDEKQELIFGVTNDDEQLFNRCARRIRDSGIDLEIPESLPGIARSNAPRHLPDRRLKKTDRRTGIKFEANKYTGLWWALAGSIASAAALKLSGILPSLLFILVSGVFLARHLISCRTKTDKGENGDENLSDVRRMILFSDGDENGAIRSRESISEKKNKPFDSVTPLSTGILTAVSAEGGAIDSYSIMMDRTTIGSDVFLSDIVIDDPSVDALHAVIYLDGRMFYISDCSRKGTTYIDDRKVANGRRCEIKNGQKITIGTKDFSFRVPLPSVGQAWTSEHQIRNAQ